MKIVSRLLIIASVFFAVLLGCKKNPSNPCEPISEICYQAKITESREFELDITWDDATKRKQTYTVIVFDSKTKEVLFEGVTKEKKITAYKIPTNITTGITVSSSPCKEKATIYPEKDETISIGKIIIGDIQCFRP